MMDLDRIPPLTELADVPPEEGNEPPGWAEQQQRTTDLNELLGA